MVASYIIGFFRTQYKDLFIDYKEIEFSSASVV